MEDLKQFNEIFESIENKQDTTELMQILQKINELIKKDQENFVELCYYFKLLKQHFTDYDKKHLMNYSGYENKNGRWYYERIIQDYGLSEKTVNKMIQIANRFIDKKLGAEPKIRSAFLGYNKSKLVELLALSDKQIEIAINSKRITPNLSFRQIREYVKSLKGGEKEENKVLEESTNEDNSEELEKAFDPKKEYNAEYYNSKSKSVLVSFCIDLQDTVQSLLKRKK